MLLRGIRPDKHTFPLLLTACRHSGDLFYGKQIHTHALKLGYGRDDYVVTALMTLYGKFEGVKAAHYVFDKMANRNSVAWTLLSGLYIAKDRPDLALDVFKQMVVSGIVVDSVAMATAIGACTRMKSLNEGRKVHEIARKNGLESNVLVGNSLLKMYLDCGNLKDAGSFFNQMPVKDTVSWTAIIGKYVQNGSFNEGLKLFRSMQSEGTKPDSFAVSSVLPACARISALKHGKEIHGHIVRNAIELNIAVQNALMDMYVKAGCVDSASKIFERMVEKDAVSWTVMILGYSLHGRGEVGVQLFHEMEQQSRIQPDQMAYVAALHACNTACMVEEGMNYFNCIRAPRVDHYALIVRLLSRAKLFDEARAFIEEHSIGRHVEVQQALLNGCRTHRNIKMGKRVIELLTVMDSLNAGNFVMLSNVYAANAKWDMVKKMREMIIDMGLKPRKAYSWIEFRNKVHTFGVGDVSHPKSERLYYELQELMIKMKDLEGYVPEDDFALHDVDEERECIPCGHSEMLAISFGLVSTQANTIVRVTKNLRVCLSCHTSAKMISKIVDREIVLKDPECFHHFRNGYCSCRDNW